MQRGIIPVLHVTARSLAEAWENSLIELYQKGRPLKTEYDAPNDPPSKDATLTFTVLEPNSEPRFHRCFPGGPADLMEYRMEVVDGIHDHWMELPDPNGTLWDYTYHQRLTKYKMPTENSGSFAASVPPRNFVDQLEWCAQKLSKSPHSRRVQAVTWEHKTDMNVDDPPCLQSLWFRIVVDDDGTWWLNMNVRFRSRDAYKAAFMNADAFIHLMERMAARISEIAGRPVRLGRYTDQSDSYHIYGKDLAQFDREFIGGLKRRSFSERVWSSEMMLPMMTEAVPEILKKAKYGQKEES